MAKAARQSTDARVTATAGSTVDPAEIARFAKLADSWWDPEGPSKALHRLNPVRLAYLRDQLAEHFARPVASPRPFAGLRLVDIGCGGGLIAEPMTRLGFAVTGIDATAASIDAACNHAEAVGLAIDYRAEAAEALVTAGERFDVVLALEIVEHVADLAAFLAAAASLVQPGGMLVAATLNRTTKAYLTAVLGAEYVLGWLPRGTHDWKKFVRPSELAAGLRRSGLRVSAATGIGYSPLGDRWSLSSDLGVNYMMVAVRPGA